jgi:hypothetical protein
VQIQVGEELAAARALNDLARLVPVSSGPLSERFLSVG